MTSSSNMVAFLPWFQLHHPVDCAGMRFMPWKHGTGRVSGDLDQIAEPLNVFLSAYRNVDGTPIRNCVIVCHPQRNPTWSQLDSDFEAVQEATLLLYLACASRNDYVRGWGSYVNSSKFELVWQRFGSDYSYVTLVTRRRDGETTTGGYRHDRLVLSEPLNCGAGTRYPDVDRGLISALDFARAGGTATASRLRTTMPLVALANTDNNAMRLTAEALLMVSAYEILLHAPGQKYVLCRKLAELLKPFGTVDVVTGRAARPGIALSDDPRQATSQENWFLHQKWIEEFYQVRSRAAHHGGDLSNRAWGWSLFEHLLMAMFVLPLVVKLRLVRENCYALTEDDEVCCVAVDSILATPRWYERDGSDTAWTSAMNEAVRARTSAKVMEFLKSASETGNE